MAIPIPSKVTEHAIIISFDFHYRERVVVSCYGIGGAHQAVVLVTEPRRIQI